MAARLLIALASALALVGGGYWWGHTATDNAGRPSTRKLWKPNARRPPRKPRAPTRPLPTTSPNTLTRKTAMPLSMPLIKTFAAVCLLLFLGLWLLSPAANRLGLTRRARMSGVRLQLLAIAALSSLLLLSACGTAPSPAPTRRPVPAALLVPPKAPTLLVPKAPASPSTTPGPTTPPTPRPARPTASATNA